MLNADEVGVNMEGVVLCVLWFEKRGEEYF